MTKNILIVEDDEAIAELERDYLEINGYSALIVQDGKAGIDAFHSGDFSLIVLDINIPICDGFEVLREIRKNSNIPILIVTAKNSEVDKIRGLGLGSDDYITKPFSLNEFVARVGAHISRYERLTTHADIKKNVVLTIHSLKIDLTSRRVVIGNDEIALTNKEFDLLAFFAQNPDKVFTKDQLLDSVWGYESFADSSTVTVHIKKLRSKIEKSSHSPELIETVWGVGYRFKV